MIRAILYYAALILLVAYLLNQVRKPSRWIGRSFVWLMNLSHSDLTDWGREHVPIEKRLTMLDVVVAERFRSWLRCPRTAWFTESITRPEALPRHAHEMPS